MRIEGVHLCVKKGKVRLYLDRPEGTKAQPGFERAKPPYGKFGFKLP